ncbi:MAG: penicillin acylase family protein [Dehalococcoidia bacterium]
MKSLESLKSRLPRPPRPLTRAASTVEAAARRARAAAVAAALVRSTRSHPTVEGTLHIEGPDAAIEVLRDVHGVPHVYASSERDALFGQGFVHAQDRLFQLDSTRRFAQGRLAELAGPRMLESDRLLRRFGLADRAARDVAAATSEERALLHAYASGVNAGVRSLHALPPEFALLEVLPEPWQPQDTMLIGRFVLLTFASNWDTELLRERLLPRLGPERLAELDATALADARTVTGEPPLAAGRLLEALRVAHEAGLPVGGASNAWAVAGHRSATGKPLLAADPHLQARIPSLFHVVGIEGGAIRGVGAGIPGIPGLALGHNGRMAWGIAAGMADTADTYAEEVDPADPTRYLTPDGWATGRTRIERIAVAGGATVEEHVLETRHGPVIGPAVRGEDRAVALRATCLEEGALVSPFLDVLRASNPWEFEAAVARWPGSTFNFVWAHIDGDIGYRMGGSVPQRAHGEGLMPQNGPTSSGPQPPWPPEAMPRVSNPASGLVVSANDAPGGAIELGAEWAESTRAERIEALLLETPQHDVASMQAIQGDRHSRPLSRLRDLLSYRALVEDIEIAALLEGWDGALAPDSAAAAVLEGVYVEAARALVTRLAGADAPFVLGAGITALSGSSFHFRLQSRLIGVLEAPRAPWLEDETARDRLLRAAVGRALQELRANHGSDRAKWRWGTIHPLSPDHPLGVVPVVGRLFRRGPFPYGGDSNTVNQNGYSVHRGPGHSGFVPAYRQVIDLAEPDASTFALPLGNSGIPGHPRYDDFIEEYLEGRQRPLLFTRAAVEAQLEHRLHLVPASEASS